ncbi:transcriptional regulator [Micromonospora rosaria]|uniref:Transcriptional regulator n=1 Tax=Micromonospora rosaria TaxID=47874 RepID=A0A136PJS4_9ACTN|nr:FCD domain-containing protein [Micromonospora rosaria]KXK58672.1 transcriptional regulator [Micromonospora rosaria]
MGEATRDAARSVAPVLHDKVIDALGLEITSGQHAPGAALTLERLQQRFGVSRTVMREVMRILESLSLVQSRRRVGLVVQPISRWRVLDPRVIRWRLDGPGRADQLRTLTELRVAVEPLAAAGAARHAAPAQRQRLGALAARMRHLGEAGQLDAFLEVDVEFHALLLHGCHNEMFSALTDVITEVLAGRTEHGLMPRPPRPVALDLHERVASCVAAGDARGAEAAMRELVEEVRDAISATASCGAGLR